MRKTISEEQLVAIRSEGGVALSAGAGAGKTFVIIEHFIEILKKYENGHPEVDVGELLSKTVIITFTKKAARELKKRIELELRKYIDNGDYWKKVYENRGNCFVGTIHSYCFMLLKGVKSFDFSSLEIVEDSMIKQKVKKYALEQIEKNSSILQSYEFKDLKHSLEKIFFSTNLRLEWEGEATPSSKEVLVNEFFELYKINGAINTNFEKKLKWTEFLVEFVEVTKEQNKVKKFENLVELFSGLKRFPTPSKKTVSEEITNLFVSIKEMRDGVLEFNEALADFNQSFIDKSNSFKVLFREISSRYFEDGKISFSDIEYLMTKYGGELEIEVDKLIVDEFQDVSQIQFDIFSNIVRNDFQKMFVVGDKKQAIYGFRGGEISVFEKFENEVNNTLWMVDNYRSAPEVVQFNNKLFENEFKSELAQNPRNEISGNVEVFNIELAENEQREMKELEIDALFQVLRRKINKGCGKIAILYRYLNSAKGLIEKLMNENIGFECTLKIEKSQDPMLSILRHLINVLVDKQSTDNAIYFINGYLNYLDISSVNLRPLVEDFVTSCDLLGISISWSRFLGQLGINYGYCEMTFNQIDQLERFFENSPSKILHALGDSLDERIAIDVSNRFYNTKISLMTAHSSKGLEFDEVILANIFSNNRGRSDKIVLGETPFSFIYQKEGKKLLTPNFLLERRKNLLKSESESQRLFYVACTRAVRKLTFLTFPLYKGNISDKCWGHYLLKEINNLPVAESLDLKLEVAQSVLSPKSDYHNLNFQIIENENKSMLGVMPEVSVTKLALLKICPRKFYFKNIIGLDEEDFPRVESEKKSELKSSAQRGSLVHQSISNYFNDGIALNERDFKFLNDLLINYKEGFQFLSEKEIKFELDGKMISGTPDLVVLKNETIEVWDFKTGAQDVEKDKIYQVQIALYLFAHISLSDKLYTNIISKILYLDEKKTLEKVYSSFDELQKEIEELVHSIYYYQRNLGKHCEQCSYKSICLTEPLLSDTHLS